MNSQLRPGPEYWDKVRADDQILFEASRRNIIPALRAAAWIFRAGLRHAQWATAEWVPTSPANSAESARYGGLRGITRRGPLFQSMIEIAYPTVEDTETGRRTFRQQVFDARLIAGAELLQVTELEFVVPPASAQVGYSVLSSVVAGHAGERVVASGDAVSEDLYTRFATELRWGALTATAEEE
jgi:hypothetical protein